MGDYASVNRGRKRPSKAARWAKLALAIIATVACIVVLAYFAVTFAFQAVNSSLQTTQLPALSERTALSALEGTQTNEQLNTQLSSFSYLSTENLIGPRFGNVAIEEATFDEQNVPQRSATAEATWRNGYATITALATAHFTFDSDAKAWASDALTITDVTVVPLRAPNVNVITADALSLLAERDAATAARFADASLSTSASLDTTGGLITVTLAIVEQKSSSGAWERVAEPNAAEQSASSTDSAGGEPNADGSATANADPNASGAGGESANNAGEASGANASQEENANTSQASKQDERRTTCVFTLSVTWSNTQGWLVSIADEPQVSESVTEKSAERETLRLTCSEGGPVELSGTIRANGDRFTLEADCTVVITIGASTWTTDWFDLTTTSTSPALQPGDHVKLQGTASTANATDSTPLSITVTAIQALAEAS